MEGEAGRVRVAGYNVHRCVGMDRRHDPRRVGAVLRELGAAVIGLQEVDSHPEVEAGLDQVEFLARETGLVPVVGPTLLRHEGHYGNALLTSGRVLAVRRHDLSQPGREPRGALDVDLDLGGRRLRLLTTHLGLRGDERDRQIERLLAALDAAVADPDRGGEPLVLVGDFNEWQPGSRRLAGIERRLGRTPALPTFPSRFRLLALDRIWVRPRSALERLDVHRSPLARVASDHLPVVATLRL